MGNEYFLWANLVLGYWWNSHKVLQFVNILGIVGIAMMFFCYVENVGCVGVI
jgi:hypothetical protein